MFTAALFIATKNWKQPKCPSNNKWVNKVSYSTFNETLFGHRNEWNTDTCYILHQKHYAKWRKPTHTKSAYCKILCMLNIQNRQMCRRKRLGGEMGRMGVRWEITANVFNVSFGGDKNIQKLHQSNGPTTLYMYTELYTLSR